MLERNAILGPAPLPPAGALVARGQALAKRNPLGSNPFLTENGVASEAAYKRRVAGEGRIMRHAQIGYRDLERSKRAYAEIHETLTRAGVPIDRYGLCLDWSMGYPPDRRARMPKGTGLILERAEDFAALTAMAPVAPHFGDFVMGMPGAVETTLAALSAGATTIGNLGQYFNFRLPHWTDDVATTEATVVALALCAAQPVEILIHSNLDDGFASLFTDLSCSMGMVLIERHIIETLLGGRMSHCFGHTFSDPLTRLAFQRAIARTTDTPGSMLYGNTTAYRSETTGNYAGMASYLLIDSVGQHLMPSGHAVNPVPVTEAHRIPETDEVVEAHIFADRLIEHANRYVGLIDLKPVDAATEAILDGGERFKVAALGGLAEAGIDCQNPVELLLALRRIGARQLEQAFGPGAPAISGKRVPIVPATTILELEDRAQRYVDTLSSGDRAAIGAMEYRVCLATTDVHEYGKVLVESTLEALGVTVIDAGVSVDPDTIVEAALRSDADAIAISTYNGIAKDFLRGLRNEMAARGLDKPIFIGGRLNQIPDGSNTSLPVDVSAELAQEGAIVCRDLDDLVKNLMARTMSRQAAHRGSGESPADAD